MIHFGEVEAGCASEDEFYDAVVMHMQSQYDEVGGGNEEIQDDMKSDMNGGEYYNWNF